MNPKVNRPRPTKMTDLKCSRCEKVESVPASKARLRTSGLCLSCLSLSKRTPGTNHLGFRDPSFWK